MSSLTVYAPQITILDQAINMIDGLYSLNDMHRASGSDKKHQPAFFMRNQETKDLIKEVEVTDNIKAVKRVQGGNDKSKQGTYVCKDLVYRYAMWISPKFALLVIRTFDKLVTGELRGQPTQLSTAADRKPLVEAVNMYCAKTGAIYSDVWKLVHQRFNIERVHEMTLEQVPQAVEYVHSFILQAKQVKELEVSIDNEFWRYVGIIKHQELTQALRQAKDVMNNLYQAIGSAQSHTGLIYDAFGEQQRQSGLGKDGHHEAYIKAKDFVARQEAMMKRF
ncbi:KilA-N domain-containing protein [Psychrobacter pocilloporae]|uniref:KilA-N domain-containing protein n=1 Tax=Psychrobacter pocilloporae TaxID=1775882 RepID=UPI003C2EEF1D